MGDGPGENSASGKSERTCERYLRELAQRECEERRRKRIGKLLKESGLPLEKSLANFDAKRMPVKVSRRMKVLLEGGLLDRKENLLIFGNPGAGKSHLLCAPCAGVDRGARNKDQVRGWSAAGLNVSFSARCAVSSKQPRIAGRCRQGNQETG